MVSRRTTVMTLAVLGLAMTACGGAPASEPTLGTVDFSSRVVFEIHDHELRVTPGPRAGVDPTASPLVLPSGSVVDVVNDTTTDQRLQGNAGKIFDTGIMRPTERTTIVVTNTTSTDTMVTITDPVDGQVHGSFVVRPAQPA
jgi:hypothetical protein